MTADSPSAVVPAVVRQLAGADRIRPVWDNEAGGRTFELRVGVSRRFVKWTPLSSGVDLSREVARLSWAADFAVVPAVLDSGVDDSGSWLLTDGLAGENAVSPRWRAEPATAVAVLGSGLRLLHDSLPVTACPFSWSAADRLADARVRAAAGRLAPVRWHPEHRNHTVAGALAVLADIPDASSDFVVVCHGDACAPNTLITDDGYLSGHVDPGDLGIGDRWSDLAIATWSTRWNYGANWERPLLDAYGIDPDPDRTAYYRLLWDLGP